MLTTIVMSGHLTFAQYCEKRNLSGQKEIAQGRKVLTEQLQRGGGNLIQSMYIASRKSGVSMRIWFSISKRMMYREDL